MSTHQDVAKLRSLTKRWYPKSPKKFNANLLINEVHQTIFEHGPGPVHLNYLVHSQYLERVLWKNFDEDVSTTYIELLTTVLDFQIAKLGSKWSFLNDILRDDFYKFDQFLDRIISITSVISSKSNFRLYGSILKFLASFSQEYLDSNQPIISKLTPLFDQSILEHLKDYDELIQASDKIDPEKNSVNYDARAQLSLKTKHNWAINLIRSITTLVLESKITKNWDFQLFLENFLHLSISVISSESTVSEYFRTFVFSSNIAGFLYTVGPKALVNYDRVVKMITWLEHFIRRLHLQDDELLRLQEIIFRTFGEGNPAIESILKLTSPKEISKPQLKELLSTIEIGKLHAILKEHSKLDSKRFIHNNLKSESENSELAKEIVLNTLVFKVLNDVNSLSDFYKYEESTYDSITSILKARQNSTILVDPLHFPKEICTSSSELNTLFEQNLNNTLEKEVSIHLEVVLNRLKIDSNLSIKGSSKYFYQLSGVSISEGHSYEIQLNRKFESDSHTLALLELVKPNKFAKAARVQDFGLNLVRLATVQKGKDKSLVVSCFHSDSVDSFEDRMRYAIAIPNSVSFRILESQLRPKYQQTPILENIFTNQSQSIQFDLGQIASNNNQKKRKISANEGTSAASDFDDQHLVRALLENSTVAVNYTSHSGVDMVLHKVLDYLRGERTILVVPSRAYLTAFETDGRDVGNFNFVRIKLEEEISEISSLANSSVKSIANLFEQDSQSGSILNNLNFYEEQVKLLWKQYLSENKNNPSDMLSKYPFSEKDTKFASFEEIIKSYSNILHQFEFLRCLSPHWIYDDYDTNPGKVWNHLLRIFNPVIAFEDILTLGGSDISYSFDNVYIVNGTIESLSAILKLNDRLPKRVAFVGGDIIKSLPRVLPITSSKKVGVRSEFLRNEAAENIYDQHLRAFNPGFKYPAQYIEVEDQVEEAEYSILLFQFMRLLGYPASKIGIFVSAERQKALVQEIISHKLAQEMKKKLKEKVASKGFFFGVPAVVMEGPSHEVDFFDFAIISSHSEEPCWTRVPGKLGNYFIGDSSNINQLTVALPSDSELKIITGENYSTQTRKKSPVYAIEGKEHLEQYVKQMTAARLANGPK